MEWEPNERDAWVSDAQRWICQIIGVLQCKIDLDEAGGISGVHVVAGMERDPRHIVRDVEGLLKARLDMDVYYKKIGVVQVLDKASAAPLSTEAGSASTEAVPDAATATEEPRLQAVPGSTVTFHPPREDQSDRLDDTLQGGVTDLGAGPGQPASPAAAPALPAILVAADAGARVVCEGVGVMASDTTIRAEVQLRAGEVEARGLIEGANHAANDILLVAQAAVAAVAELISDPVLLKLNEVRLEDVGGQTVVLIAVDLVEGRQGMTLFGTCSTSHNRYQAVVYAVLDALNRRLTMHGLKTLEGAE